MATLAAASGGFQPTSWGWSAALLLVLVAVAVLVGGRRLSPLEWALPAALAGLAAWTWLSLVWSDDVAQTVQEGERLLVYLAGATALLLLGRRASVGAVVAGLWAAIVVISVYALTLRLLAPGRGAYQVISSDPEASFRLSRPLGYANALAIFAAIGILLALGLALRGRGPLRGLAAASLVILAPTLYFTYGRGAWLGLAAGLCALFALERGRVAAAVRAAALAIAPAIAVVLASRTHGLTADPSSVAAARHDGRLLAVAVVCLAVAAAFVPAGLDRLLPRVQLGRSARRGLALAVGVVVLAIAVAAVAAVGGPRAGARRAYHAFNAPAPLVRSDASNRLFSLSGSNRSDYWRVAWREVEAHPLLGGGAGSFQRFWLRHRSAELPVLDAHSLYLETLAELGAVGLALLLCVLTVPLLGLRTARRTPFAAAALGGYVAFLVHAGIDWDWEMPAVTLTALACGVALLLAARGDDSPRPARPVRIGLAAGAAALVVLALGGFVGNRAEASASDALDASRLNAAAHEARQARRWEPWSSEPWRLLGEAQLQAGEVADARASFRHGLAKDGSSWELWLDLALVTRGAERQAALAHVAALNPLSSELRQLRSSG
ncbi:MAG TPA: O-antigen ligase family protein [Gaiellaceae bacterium]|nr:O-antigen ligase family protein [Gaiellaceae bacterium]